MKYLWNLQAETPVHRSEGRRAMFNYRIVAIVKRELKEKLLSKSFIISTLLIPLFMFGIIIVQGVVMQFKGDKNTILEIISESQALSSKLKSAFLNDKSIKESKYSIQYKSMSRAQADKYVEGKNKELINGKIEGIVFVPETAFKDKGIEYYSKTPQAFAVTSKISGPINACLMDVFFKDKPIAAEELNYARSNVSVKTYKVSEEKRVEETGIGNLILAYLFSFLLYFSLIMLGSQTMQSVIEEKNSRVVEILLSSVHSRELLTGKILGVAITGVFQMAIWLLPAFILISTTWFALPPQLSLDVSPWLLLYFLFNYFIGMITFIGLFAMVGAIFDNAQDAQSGMWPIMIAIMIPFFITFSMANNPNNPLANAASLLPLASIIVMPAKMTITGVAAWKVILSVLINLTAVAAVFTLAGKIYRVGILRTGTKPKWSDVVKWLQYKY
jgi:ABC-2 type transport system permease protein